MFFSLQNSNQKQFKIIALSIIGYSCCTLPILRLEDVLILHHCLNPKIILR